MGFDVVYLPPIHPIGRTLPQGAQQRADRAGPGDPGSPWAIGSAEGGHTRSIPSSARSDDFDRFVAPAAALGLEVALDFAIQCSPDHPWVREHPEWFFHRPDGTIKYAENPPKKYQDIYPRQLLRRRPRGRSGRRCGASSSSGSATASRTFRVDNPHTKPVPFWEWLIREVQTRASRGRSSWPRPSRGPR